MHIIKKLGFATAFDRKSHCQGTQIFLRILTNLFPHHNQSFSTSKNIFLSTTRNMCARGGSQKARSDDKGEGGLVYPQKWWCHLYYSPLNNLRQNCVKQSNRQGHLKIRLYEIGLKMSFWGTPIILLPRSHFQTNGYLLTPALSRDAQVSFQASQYFKPSS